MLLFRLCQVVLDNFSIRSYDFDLLLHAVFKVHKETIRQSMSHDLNGKFQYEIQKYIYGFKTMGKRILGSVYTNAVLFASASMSLSMRLHLPFTSTPVETVTETGSI